MKDSTERSKGNSIDQPIRMEHVLNAVTDQYSLQARIYKVLTETLNKTQTERRQKGEE